MVRRIVEDVARKNLLGIVRSTEGPTRHRYWSEVDPARGAALLPLCGFDHAAQLSSITQGRTVGREYPAPMLDRPRELITLSLPRKTAANAGPNIDRIARTTLPACWVLSPKVASSLPRKTPSARDTGSACASPRGRRSGARPVVKYPLFVDAGPHSTCSAARRPTSAAGTVLTALRRSTTRGPSF